MFFGSLVTGGMRSFLPKFKNAEELKKLNIPVFHYELNSDTLIAWLKHFEISLNDTQGYNLGQCDKLSININPINDTLTLRLFTGEETRKFSYKISYNKFRDWWLTIPIPAFIVEEYNINEGSMVLLEYDLKKKNVNIPLIKDCMENKAIRENFKLFGFQEPDDFSKTNPFLDYIDRQMAYMKAKAQKVVLNTVDTNHLVLYARRNLIQLNNYAKEAQILYKKFEKINIAEFYHRNGDFKITLKTEEIFDPDFYIAHALREYILDAILFYNNNLLKNIITVHLK